MPSLPVSRRRDRARISVLAGRAALLFGLATVALLWLGVGYHIDHQRSAVDTAIYQNASNLTRIFEEYVTRTIKELDEDILLVREAYERDPAGFAPTIPTASPGLNRDLPLPISIIGRDGRVLASALGPAAAEPDLGEHLRYHREAADDQLFISKPLPGPNPNVWSIQLSRRLRDRDGSFAGVVVARLNPYDLARFYENVDLGAGGVVMLAGTDGIVRVRRSFDGISLGQSIAGSRLMAQLHAVPVGSFVGRSNVDGIRRIYSYRVLKEFPPLLVSVGVGEDEVLGPYRRDDWILVAVAAGFSLLILPLGFLADRRRRAMQRKSAELEITLEHMSQGILMADARGRIGVLNRRAVEVLDLPATLIHPGLRFTDITAFQTARGDFDRGAAVIDPRIREIVLSFALERLPPRYERTQPDGTVIEVRSTRLGDQGFILTYTDITERKRFETTLAAKNAILEAMLRTIPDGIAVLDGSGRMVLCNDRLFEVLDLDRDRILASPDPYAARVKAMAERGDYGTVDIDRLVDSRRTLTLRAEPSRWERRLATGRWIEGRGRPIESGGAVWTYRDVTEAKEHELKLEASQARLAAQATQLAIANERLENARREAELARHAAEAASRTKSVFLANMSHEIRTPLNGIIGFAQLLRREPMGPMGRRQYLDYAGDILTSGEHLLDIINDILDISKLEAGRIELEMLDFELPELVGEVAKLLLPRAAQKGLTIETTLDPRVRQPFRGDSSRLRQVLINLVGNAIKFTGAGKIRLDIRPVEGPGRPAHDAPNETGRGTMLLRFVVRDTGIGIAPEARRRIFQKFSQADSSITRRFGGTGLGLTICKELVELMGGEIGLDSSEGHGSTFWFTLPLAPAGAAWPAAAPRAPPPSDAADPAPASPRRVLLVEDNEINQRLAAMVLGRAGYEVTVAGDGAAALATLARESFDLVLMDIEMPAMDGLETTRQLRRLAGPAAAIPVVAMTAHAMPGIAEQCRAAGMDDYVSKPFEISAFLKVVERWVRLGTERRGAAGAVAR